MERPGVGPLNHIVHHSITERSIPAKRRVHNAPLDDILMIVTDDFLFPALALGLPLAFGSDALLDELLAMVTCPEISENKNKGRVCGEPISVIVPRL
jgi:hypothetical protein